MADDWAVQTLGVADGLGLRRLESFTSGVFEYPTGQNNNTADRYYNVNLLGDTNLQFGTKASFWSQLLDGRVFFTAYMIDCTALGAAGRYLYLGVPVPHITPLLLGTVGLGLDRETGNKAYSCAVTLNCLTNYIATYGLVGMGLVYHQCAIGYVYDHWFIISASNYMMWNIWYKAFNTSS